MWQPNITDTFDRPLRRLFLARTPLTSMNIYQPEQTEAGRYDWEGEL